MKSNFHDVIFAFAFKSLLKYFSNGLNYRSSLFDIWENVPFNNEFPLIPMSSESADTIVVSEICAVVLSI